MSQGLIGRESVTTGMYTPETWDNQQDPAVTIHKPVAARIPSCIDKSGRLGAFLAAKTMETVAKALIVL